MNTTQLVSLHPGDSCKVQKISAGCNATRRLYEMGLNTGTTMKIIKNDIGPIIISLCGNKIAIGRGLADKILVEH